VIAPLAHPHRQVPNDLLDLGSSPQEAMSASDLFRQVIKGYWPEVFDQIFAEPT
jgi:hypothetical protein